MASAVAGHAFARDADGQAQTLELTGRQHSCSGRSVSRWASWVVGLTDIEALARACVRADPEGMPAVVRVDGVGVRDRAGRALAVFDHFARLLEEQGVLPRGDRPSLVRLLEDQRTRHRVTFPLLGLSPPLSFGVSDTAPHGR